MSQRCPSTCLTTFWNPSVTFQHLLFTFLNVLLLSICCLVLASIAYCLLILVSVRNVLFLKTLPKFELLSGMVQELSYFPEHSQEKNIFLNV